MWGCAHDRRSPWTQMSVSPARWQQRIRPMTATGNSNAVASGGSSYDRKFPAKTEDQQTIQGNAWTARW